MKMNAHLMFGNDVRRKRHEKHVSQVELAQSVGCSQTAISKIEAGELDALSKEKLTLLCRELGLSFPGSPSEVLVLSFCGNSDCPLGWREVVNGKLIVLPGMFRLEPAMNQFCKACGTLLLSACQEIKCGAPAQEGAAFCIKCGTALVQIEKHQQSGDLEEYKERMNRRCRLYREESQRIEIIATGIKGKTEVQAAMK
jgi:transcriptional regulator with XRE-family HTH domain